MSLFSRGASGAHSGAPAAAPGPDGEQGWLPGRADAVPVAPENLVTHHPMTPPYPADSGIAIFGMGCFWGVERLFWSLPGVWTTAAGYAGGVTPNPSYEEVCTGRTGHAEVVLVVYEPATVSYDQLLRVFWENHDPTQGMRQWNDIGTQYRSAIFTSTQAQFDAAVATRDTYQGELLTAGRGEITTEIQPLDVELFYFAEDHHQQYLRKNPDGYCDLHGTGIACSISGTR
jgi:peptide-methionine (S)-S-oxide reductase